MKVKGGKVDFFLKKLSRWVVQPIHTPLAGKRKKRSGFRDLKNPLDGAARRGWWNWKPGWEQRRRRRRRQDRAFVQSSSRSTASCVTATYGDGGRSCPRRTAMVRHSELRRPNPALVVICRAQIRACFSSLRWPAVHVIPNVCLNRLK